MGRFEVISCPHIRVQPPRLSGLTIDYTMIERKRRIDERKKVMKLIPLSNVRKLDSKLYADYL